MGFTLVVSDVYSVFVRFLYEYLFGVSDAGGIDGISFLVSWAPSLPCVILHVCKSVGLSVCLSMSTYYVRTFVCMLLGVYVCMIVCWGIVL